MKQAYISLLINHQQPELAETFFNSVACRMLHRTYFNNAHIFWRPAVSTEHIESLQPTYRCYAAESGDWSRVYAAVLLDLQLLNDWEDLSRDLDALVGALTHALRVPFEAQPNAQVQVLSSLFFRNKAAYVVGRITNGAEHTPFAIPLLLNGRKQLYVDTLLVQPDELVPLFSLARAYFMVDMEVPSAFVAFLRSMLPSARRRTCTSRSGCRSRGRRSSTATCRST